MQPIFHGLALGFCVGGNSNFSLFRYQHVGIPNVKFHVGGLSQREDQRECFLVAVEYRLKVSTPGRYTGGTPGGKGREEKGIYKTFF